MDRSFRVRRPDFSIPVMAERADTTLTLARTLAQNSEQLTELSRLVTVHVTNADAASASALVNQNALVASTTALQTSLVSLAATQAQLLQVQSDHATQLVSLRRRLLYIRMVWGPGGLTLSSYKQ